MKKSFPCGFFPSLHFPARRCYYKGKQFFQHDVFNSGFSQNNSSVSGTALNLDRYIAYSIKAVPESSGQSIWPIREIRESPSFYCKLDNKCSTLFSISFKKKHSHIENRRFFYFIPFQTSLLI